MMLDSEIGASAARTAPVPPGEAPSRNRRGRRRVLMGGAVVLVVGAAAAVYALQNRAEPPPAVVSTLPTVAVERTDMVNVREVDGTLGYAGTYTVLGAKGRITWLPEAGDVIRRGDRVYGKDGVTVPLFYGATPFWRDLQQGRTGRDVLQLERNLEALGYGKYVTVDRTFTWATAQAVMAWQDDVNLPETGVFTLDTAVVQPGAIRVTDVKGLLGGDAGGTVLTASGLGRTVTVDLPVNDQGLAEKGAEVRVTLPGGKATTGRITSIGTVATAGATNAKSQTGEGTENATIPVSVTLDKASSAGRLDSAPATVGFSSTVHEDVLVVPVNALLASGEGAYSVNVRDASGAVRSVPVELGIFDGDKVEVKGDLEPGMNVEVART